MLHITRRWEALNISQCKPKRSSLPAFVKNKPPPQKSIYPRHPVELYRLVVQQHGAQKSITMMVWYQMHKGHVKLRQCQSRTFPSIPVEILEQASCSSCSLSPEHDQLGKHETPHSLDTNPQILGCLTVPCGKGSIRKHW